MEYTFAFGRLCDGTVEVIASGGAFPLRREDDGYFSGVAAEVRDGDTYRFRLDGGDAFPDPASRFQPEGPHGPSQVVNPAAFHWSDQSWTGVELAGQVIYELHIGTFTPEGTWESRDSASCRSWRASGFRSSKSCRSRISPAGLAGATTE